MKVPMKVLIFLVALCRRLFCSSRHRWRTLERKDSRFIPSGAKSEITGITSGFLYIEDIKPKELKAVKLLY